MLNCYQRLSSGFSYTDFLEFLEADISLANAFFLSKRQGWFLLPNEIGWEPFGPSYYLLASVDGLLMFISFYELLQPIPYSFVQDGRPDISSCGRKATISEFYSVILPSLQLLCDYASQVDRIEDPHNVTTISKRLEHRSKPSNLDIEREDECGICMESRTKIVLPHCCHAMCINCYHDWKLKSESCPFCRGSLKRVASRDLWILTCGDDAIDTRTIMKEDMLRFYLFINNLPEDTPDVLFLMYYEHLL